MNNKFIVGLLAALAIGAVVVFGMHKATPTNDGQQVLGASGTEHTQQENLYGGFGFGKPALSSSSPALLGSSPAFFMTATTTSQFASSTLIGTYSQVFYQFASTSPVAGVTCNPSAPASSTLSMIPSSVANATSTGFVIKINNAAPGVSSPYCVQGFILPNK